GKSTVTKQFLLTILLIFLLHAIMLSYIFSSFYRSSSVDIKDLGTSNLNSQASMIDTYLGNGRNVLWFAAESVDFMMKKGANDEELLEYLLDETKEMQERFDVNFTGIYGYLGGSYIDGAGWIPPDDYDPKTRDWYINAMEHPGEMVISSPYVDAQTGEVIISFSQTLSDGESVLSLDITMNELQNITESMTMGNMGYGFIIDKEGLIIAHYDRNKVGMNYATTSEWIELIGGIYENEDGIFNMKVNGERCTVFTEKLDVDWYVVIVAQNAVLFRKIRQQILLGVILSLIIYAIIVVFCVISVKRISNAEKSEQASLERIKRMNMNIIRSLASTIDAKDRYTSGHSQRVADYALRIAEKMGLSEDDQRIVYYAGLLHDVGKIRVPGEVINKPGKLTDEEFDKIRIHPVSGFHILRDIHEDSRIGYGAKYHHERYDGTGYPNGLEGEDIPEVARIIAVADAYDAMASDRSYRKLLPQDIVRDEILKGKGTQFDPDIADIMLNIIDEDREYELHQKELAVQNILVVDDEPMLISAVKHILKGMEQVNVFGAGNEKEAMDILADKEISLIMLDVMMPDIDGFTLYEHIREKYNIPAIIMTGNKTLDTITKIDELGISDYLTKPLIPTITLETVHGILRKYDSEI
ncbi:MAG: response regulator, partial [Lachnospiraceae bacterium]|nr:response regulator [Lachnospiraceae bacterium]